MQTGAPANPTVDHINRIKTDNRWCNLREASYAVQGANRDAQTYRQELCKNNTSGFVGVGWHKLTNKWSAAFRQKHLGLFECKQGAVEARKIAVDNYNQEKETE